MNIETFPSGVFETNCYVIWCETTKKGVIVDPAPDSQELVIPYIQNNGIQIEKILLTHSHWDHIADVKKVKEVFDVPVAIHSEDAGNLEKPGLDGLPLMFKIEGVTPDEELSDGQIFHVGEIEFEVIHTPGHSPGGVCFYSSKDAVLISGDTLFQGSIGNLSFPTANADAMWISLAKLAKLPAETKVYPGHGSSTTIGVETWLPRAKEVFGD